MDKVERNKTAVIFFILIILGIIFGGYYLVRNSKNHQNVSKEYINDSADQGIKIDNDNSYIYYSNKVVVSEDLDISYEDINININSEDAKNLMTKLNQNMVQAKESIKYAKDIDSTKVDDDSIYSAKVINYEYNESNNYLSLIVSSYDYLVLNDTVNTDFAYYVFDLTTGNLLSNHDILEKEGIKEQDVR